MASTVSHKEQLSLLYSIHGIISARMIDQDIITLIFNLVYLGFKWAFCSILNMQNQGLSVPESI